MPDHAFDPVALAVESLVAFDRFDAVGFRGDRRAYAVGLDAGANCVCVIALVGEDVARFYVAERVDVFEGRAVRRFSWREMEGERDASGVTETMNFTGEPAPRAAKSLFAGPPFAPAAET